MVCILTRAWLRRNSAALRAPAGAASLSAPVEKTLLLFDIDGTLVASGGAGERALRLGFRERFGIDDDLKNVEIAGRTDTGIARAMLGAHGLPETRENIHGFLDTYLAHLASELPRGGGRLLPGLPALLTALQARPEVVLALLTGNVERGAELKLRHFGVWEFFQFGAYADDHHDRNELGLVARQRAREKLGIDFAPARIQVLGDTRHDIACARAIGARAIAVATGKSSRAELATFAPDGILDDFADQAAVFAALGL